MRQTLKAVSKQRVFAYHAASIKLSVVTVAAFAYQYMPTEVVEAIGRKHSRVTAVSVCMFSTINSGRRLVTPVRMVSSEASVNKKQQLHLAVVRSLEITRLFECLIAEILRYFLSFVLPWFSRWFLALG